jgi:beta-galactosidase
MMVLGHLILSSSDAALARDTLWDEGWLFHRGACAGQRYDINATNDLCAAPAFNDTSWRAVELPHDWSREDLPPRAEDHEFPVVAVRYGSWKLQSGDDTAWARVDYDDSAWMEAQGGPDWREYGPAFARPNATGWYRQHFSVPDFMLNSTAVVTLSLGIISGEDQTYLNGKLLGSTPARAGDPLTARTYITARAYAIPSGLLREGETNLVAVRVMSWSGKGLGPFNSTTSLNAYPGGLFDNPNLKHHDSRVGPFDVAVSPGQLGTGYTVGGIGYYRKRFLARWGPGQRAFIRFDGVYMNSDAWINGVHLGFHPYGYTTFQYELTDHLKHAPASNVLAVRVRNSGINSRYYSGSGIYRHTWLTVVDSVHIPLWGASVTTPHVAVTAIDQASEATISTSVTVVNSGPAATSAIVEVAIYLPDSRLGGSTKGVTPSIPPGRNVTIAANITLTGGVKLWSTTSPLLHTANISVTAAGSADSCVVPFGVRSIAFNSSHGFRLNGVELKVGLSKS